MKTGNENGFTLLETLVATTLLASVMLCATLILATPLQLAAEEFNLDVAKLLEDDGLTRIRSLHRADPQTPANFGMESDEALSTIDDVDDLDGVSESPPRDQSGTVHGTPGEWTRNYEVVSVSASDGTTVVADGASKLLRVTITIQYQGVTQRELKILLGRF